MMKINFKSENSSSHITPCLIVPCVESAKPKNCAKELDDKLKGAISAAYKEKRFEGKANQTLLLNSLGLVKAQNILLVGIGKAEEIAGEKLRLAAGTAIKSAEKNGFKKVSLVSSNGAGDFDLKGSSINEDAETFYYAEGAFLSLYRFDSYKSENSEDSKIGEIIFLAGKNGNLPSLKKATDKARKIADATFLARDLSNHPSNTATPAYLADTARKMSRKLGIVCKVLGEKEMKRLGMGSLLGVSKGSDEPPKLIVMEYFKGGNKKNPIAIVGKGVTFDTGGISLKPPGNMDEMKMDMSGAAATIGAMQAIASLKLKVDVVGIVPATENMPGGSAIKPGDVLKSMNGKTIEVLNTDAEGRLILADALSYAVRYKPKAIIDLATLTGAVIHALGHHISAVISNNDDLVSQLKQSGDTTGEKVWQLPLLEEYEKAMKSGIADLKNIAGPGVGAGTITGGAFLKSFIGDCPWAHLDIAGTAWGEGKAYVPKGASGVGVRLLLDLVEKGI
jgi:leucyl aminopeptidase